MRQEFGGGTNDHLFSSALECGTGPAHLISMSWRGMPRLFLHYLNPVADSEGQFLKRPFRLD